VAETPTGTGPCLILKVENATCVQRALQGQSTSRMSLWSSVGKPGDLGDHLGNKISADSDQGLEIRRICWLDLWDCCVLSPFIPFLMPS